MKDKYCYRCLMTFNRDSRMIEHLIKKNICEIKNINYDADDEKRFELLLGRENFDIETDFNKHVMQYFDESKNKFCYQCKLCERKLMDKRDMNRHLMNSCLNRKYRINNDVVILLNDLASKKKSIKLKRVKINNNLDDNKFYENIVKKMDDMQAEFKENLSSLKNDLGRDIQTLKNKPTNTTNINNLQVLCIDANQNTLDLLTEKYGNFGQALEFIKGCALSNMSGDIRLIEKIYLENKQPCMWYLDKKRCKIGWLDENGDKCVDLGGRVIMRKLANTLQNGYLKGVSYLIEKNANHGSQKFLADYDIQSWNDHIYNLRDEKYQIKLLSYLDIPGKPLNN